MQGADQAGAPQWEYSEYPRHFLGVLRVPCEYSEYPASALQGLMRAHGSGFGGKGFKFDDDEEQAQKDKHKMEVRWRSGGSPHGREYPKVLRSTPLESRSNRRRTCARWRMSGARKSPREYPRSTAEYP